MSCKYYIPSTVDAYQKVREIGCVETQNICVKKKYSVFRRPSQRATFRKNPRNLLLQKLKVEVTLCGESVLPPLFVEHLSIETIKLVSQPTVDFEKPTTVLLSQKSPLALRELIASVPSHKGRAIHKYGEKLFHPFQNWNVLHIFNTATDDSFRNNTI